MIFPIPLRNDAAPQPTTPPERRAPRCDRLRSATSCFHCDLSPAEFPFCPTTNVGGSAGDASGDMANIRKSDAGGSGARHLQA